MASVSGTSNPTNLRKIAVNRVGLLRFEVGGTRKFQVTHLDLTGHGFEGNEKVIIIARAGNTSQRYDIGTVESWTKESLDLSGLDTSHVPKFRLLLRTKGSPKLIATAENLRCAGDGDIESLLPVVSIDLGQRLWAIRIDDEGALLQCNSRIFPTGASAESYPPFRALVLPEALRLVLEFIAKDPERVNTEDSVWVEWGAWMRNLGMVVPPPPDEDLRDDWVRESIGVFCDNFKCADDLQTYLTPSEPS